MDQRIQLTGYAYQDLTAWSDDKLLRVAPYRLFVFYSSLELSHPYLRREKLKKGLLLEAS